MVEHSFLKRRWKLIVNIVTVLALVVLVVAVRDQLRQAFDDLFRINAWALLLIIPIEFLNYDAQTRLYQGLFRIVGNRLSYKFLLRTSLELNFVNHVFPSGGVTGISYFGVRLRNGEITGAKATLVQLMKLVLLIVSFEILIAFGVLFLAVEGHINDLILLLAGVITTSMVGGTALFAYIIGTRERIAGFFTWVTRMLNKLIHLVRPKHHETINIARAREAFDDLHDNYMLIRKDLGALRWPFLWALLANFWEVMAVYIVYVAFGDFVNLGAVILAYAVANFAGLVSVLPGGVGIYEGLMTLVLVASGIPSGMAVAVTVMYRVVNTIVQIPPGYYFYHKAVQGAKTSPPAEA